MFKDSIKTFRYQHLYTKTRLAKRLNVSKSMMDDWESGKAVPDEKQLEDISDRLNVSKSCLTDNKVSSKNALISDVLIGLMALCFIAFAVYNYIFLLGSSWDSWPIYAEIACLVINVVSKIVFRKNVLSDILFVPVILESLLILLNVPIIVLH